MRLSLGAEVNQTRLSLTWKDCGDGGEHLAVQDIQPLEVIIGADTLINGTSITDKLITGGSFEIRILASHIIKHSYSGSACEPKGFLLPLGLGDMYWPGLRCPVSPGLTSVAFGIHFQAFLPAVAALTFATTDFHISALDQDGDAMLCLSTHLKKEKTADVGSVIV